MKGERSNLLSDAEIDAIVRRYRAGETIRELAAHFAVSTARIQRAAVR